MGKFYVSSLINNNNDLHLNNYSHSIVPGGLLVTS